MVKSERKNERKPLAFIGAVGYIIDMIKTEGKEMTMTYDEVSKTLVGIRDAVTDGSMTPEAGVRAIEDFTASIDSRHATTCMLVRGMVYDKVAKHGKQMACGHTVYSPMQVMNHPDGGTCCAACFENIGE